VSHEQFTAEQLLAEANRHGGLVADMLTYAATLRQAARVDLPDAIRVPLDEVRADLGYLFGRVAADGSFMQAAIDSCRIKLDKVRAALEAALSARPAMGVAGEVVAMRDAVGACCDGIQTRIAELEAQPAERQGEALKSIEARLRLAIEHGNVHGWETARNEIEGILGSYYFTHPAAPVGVPEAFEVKEVGPFVGGIVRKGDWAINKGNGCTRIVDERFAQGWNACRDAMLAAAPSAPQGDG
jgi:hypothetical protein